MPHINIKECFTYEDAPQAFDHLPDVTFDTDRIQVVMINEVVPANVQNDFYQPKERSDYAASALALFAQANIQADEMIDALEKGIYVTNAIKQPKEESSVPTTWIDIYSYVLEKELSMFPNVKVIMCMGDVAIKTLNKIARRQQKKSVIPSGSTYKLRKEQYYWNDILVMPSYIMTGNNLKIEKSKSAMIVEDLKFMMEYTHKAC